MALFCCRRMPLSKTTVSPMLAWCALASLLLLAWLCYSPGLQGSFLFDDFVNLNALGKRGPIDNGAAFLRYITSGTADPTGRPLSMLSFLLDARDWPAEPAPFLRTNLLLHLLNGLLLFLVLRRLEGALNSDPPHRDGTALLGTAMWVLHPLFVSTTLYVVQREAMLPATISLAGLLLYVDGRIRYRQSNGRYGQRQLFYAIILATPLALLCKANGLLLPVLALVLSHTAFATRPERAIAQIDERPLLKMERWILLGPSLLLAAYLAQFLRDAAADLPHRPWTIGQRLLTEPRVLLDYLGLLAAPRAISSGLFNDDYIWSVDWLHPWTTLPAIIGLLLLLSIAIRRKQVSPRFSAAVLFFFAGHLLESTSVPLELYFEHRNYLPAMLLFWPVAYAIVHWRVSKQLRILASLAIIGLMSLLTTQRTQLWGHPDRMALAWAARNPASARAQAVAAQTLIQAGEAERAAALLLPHVRNKPSEVQLALNYASARCRGGSIDSNDAAIVSAALRSAQSGDLLVYTWLQKSMALAYANECDGLTLVVVATWINNAAANPSFGGERLRAQTIEPLQGELEVYRGRSERAMAHFKTALRAFPNPDFAARLVTFLARQKQYRTALDLLNFYERTLYNDTATGFGMPWIHAKVMQSQHFWPNEFAALRKKLLEELAAGAVVGSLPSLSHTGPGAAAAEIAPFTISPLQQ